MLYLSGKDFNDLGRYKDCNKDTRYIAFSVSGLPIGVHIGICGPAEWTEDDYNTLRPYLADIGNEFIQYLDVKQAYFENGLTVNNFMFYDSHNRNSDVHNLTAGHFASLAIVAFLLLSVIFGTIYQYLNILKKSKSREIDVNQIPKRQNWMQKYLNWFGAITNASKLLFARSQDGDRNLEILNGVRVLSMLWIILGHTFSYMLGGAILNPFIVFDLFKSLSFNLVTSATYSVDIFFWLTGFLGAYILLCSIKNKNGRMQNPLMIYFHRYVRIIPTYIIAILFFWFLMSTVGNGPIFFQYKQMYTWATTWWINLVFLNNIAEINENANGWMGWTWYLPNDFQFFLLIPPIVYLLYHKRLYGLIFIASYQVVCYGVTIYAAFDLDLSPSYLKYNQAYYMYYYHRPFTRIGAFSIGVLTALILFAYKYESVNQSFLKRITDKIHNHKSIRLIMYLIGITLIFLMIFIHYPIVNYPNDFSQLFNALFLAFSRTIFVIGMSLFLLPALMGHNQPTRWLLSLDIFTPLARLTFGAYLVHPVYMIFHTYNTEKGEFVTVNQGIVNFIAWAVVSFATSLLLTLLVETPWMNLEKAFLGASNKAHKSSISDELMDKMDQQLEMYNKPQLAKKFGDSLVKADDEMTEDSINVTGSSNFKSSIN